jgi:hypothetical protein
MVQMNVLRESDYPDIMDNLSPSVNLTEVVPASQFSITYSGLGLLDFCPRL